MVFYCIVLGGLVAGSTNSFKKSAKPAMKSTLAMSSTRRDAGQTTVSFTEKIKQKSHSYETSLITALTVSDYQHTHVIYCFYDYFVFYRVRDRSWGRSCLAGNREQDVFLFDQKMKLTRCHIQAESKQQMGRCCLIITVDNE